MLSAHCSKVGSAPGSTGSERSGSRLVEEDQPAERCHRLDPTLLQRQLQKTSQFVNQFWTTTMSRGPSRDAR